MATEKNQCDVLALKLSILKKALERIDKGILRTSNNTIGSTLTILEIKVIAETALDSINEV